jgi:hypothetical protein
MTIEDWKSLRIIKTDTPWTPYKPLKDIILTKFDKYYPYINLTMGINPNIKGPKFKQKGLSSIFGFTRFAVIV